MAKDEIINDAEKLNLLADWFDKEQTRHNWHGHEVQDDLRRMARKILRWGGNIPSPTEKRGEEEAKGEERDANI